MSRKQNEREHVMGMAASQARFLGLTARKTNTEYEGQQINQQRTTLSNKSANYYNQLLGMTVPVPPSVEDYTKTVYTFTDGALSNTITAMTAQPGGLYNISYVQTYTNDFAVVSAASTVYTRVGEQPPYEYYYGSNKLRQLADGKNSVQEIDAMTPQELQTLRESDEYLKTLTDDQQLKNLLKEELEYKTQLNEKYTNGNDGNWLVRYAYNSTDKTWKPYFVDQNQLDSPNTTYNENGVSQSNINTYTVGSALESQEMKGVPARLEQDSTGRIINITLNPGEDNEVTYSVKTNTSTDQDAYDDAMNQYEYDKYQYDQSIQEINAKIEIVQAQDKNLELRLKQLDTEQDAIQTEMDAVQKVIEKNTESTFKTFG